MLAKKIGKSVGGGASVRVDAVAAGRKEISIVDLLVWAIRDQAVMAWLDDEHDRLGGMKSQLGAIVQQCLLGGRVDAGGGAANVAIPWDAVRVGLAVQGLGYHEKRLVIDCARHGTEPYRPSMAWKHVTPDGLDMPKIYDKFGKRKASSCYGRDENGKRIRLNVCHITPVFSLALVNYFKPEYNFWVDGLEKIISQLTDLDHYFIDVNSLPKKDN